MFKLLVALALTLCCGSVAWAVYYPAEDGFVADEANLLDATTESQLEQQLQQYRDSTTIEIAVATVQTTDHIHIEDYALNLGNQWKVGDRAADNGVIVVVAAQDRKMTIYFGDGYPTSFSERTAGFLIKQKMVPHFKNGDPQSGIVSGIAGLTQELSAQGYDTRWAGRSNDVAPSHHEAIPMGVPQAPRPVVIRQPMDPSVKRAWGFGFFGFLIALGLGAGLYWRTMLNRRRRELQALFTRRVEELANAIKQATKAEGALKAEFSNAIWSRALAELDNNWMERLVYTDPNDTKLTLEQLQNLNEEAKVAIGDCKYIVDLYAKAQRSKDNCPALLNAALGLVGSVKSAFAHPDVLDETKDALPQYETRLTELQGVMNEPSNNVNWIVLEQELQTVRSALTGLISSAESDVDRVRRARQALPELLEQTRTSIESIRSKNSGRYNDVDNDLDEAERRYQDAYSRSSDHSGMSALEALLLWEMLNDSHDYTRSASRRYEDHVTPDYTPTSTYGGSYGSSYSSRDDDDSSRSSGGSFGGWGGGSSSSSWDSSSSFSGGSFGSSDSGGSSGGGGASGDW